MGKEKKKLPEDDGPEVPEWIVTFSDMISLLVTFFVLIMTFSSMEEDEIIKVKGAMMGTAGTINDTLGDAAVRPKITEIDKTDPIRGIKDRHSRPPEELPEDVEKVAQKKTDEHVELDLRKIGDGLALEFGEPCYFEPGSAELPPELERSARELGVVLGAYPYMVLVEGFTDTAFRPTPTYPDAESLALARAAAVADVMCGQGGLERAKVLLNGPATDKPLGDNSTATGRRLNRRVSIRVLTLSKARTMYLEAERERIHEENLERDTAPFLQEDR